MPEFPYFPLYPTDFLGDDKVMVLSLEELGAYFRLLCISWQRDPVATIPADDTLIARLVGVTPERWSELKPRVLSCWRTRSHGTLENKRLRAIYDEMMERRQKRREAGHLGGKQTSINAEAMLQHTGDGNGNGDGTKDFIEVLKPLYPGVNVDAEIRKMQAWMLTPKGKNRHLTKRFVVNWLNKCDQPLHHKPAGKPAAKPKLSAFDRKKAHSDIEEMRRELDYARERGAATDVKHLETAIRNRQKELND